MKKIGIVKQANRNFAITSAIYMAIVAVICYFAHNWAFGSAAAHRAQFGIYNAIGSEIMIVPIIIVAAYFAYVKFIVPMYDARIAEIKSAFNSLKSASCKEVLILNSKNKVIRVYKRRNNKLVCIKNPHINTVAERAERFGN
jgi:hypothetical protein